MTPDDVRAAAEQLVDFHERFAPLFGKEQAQDHAYDYVKGLMVCPERKSIEPIALLVGRGDVSGLQKFVGAAPWADDEVMAEAQALFAEELVPSAAGSPVGTVGVIDESAFTKKGSHSAGVARQHNGRLGKEDNCQVGVFLVGVTPAGQALLDHRLFLPESWCAATHEAKDRREAAHIPEDVTFRTKPQIAAELIRGVAVLGQVELDWVVGDSEYGRAGHLLDELELLEQRYVLAVPVTWVFWTSDPAESIPAYSGRGRKPSAPRRDAAHRGRDRQRAARFGVDGAAGARRGGGSVGARVRGDPGLGHPAPQAGAAVLAVDPPVAGTRTRAEVLYLQCGCRDAAVDAGPGGLHAVPGGGVPGRQQELSRDGAVRDAVVDRLASSHDARGARPSVRDPGTEAASK
jgi:SRSO17 transposase